MSHTLLLADDSVTIQRVIELTFADEDIRVVAVGDGSQAIDRVLADPPDIVLADTGMPKRDGYEVAAFIKADPALAHIPVVLLTGAFEPVDGDRARELGCDAVLVKPFEPQVVISRVRELLGGERAAAAPPASVADGDAVGVGSPSETHEPDPSAARAEATREDTDDTLRLPGPAWWSQDSAAVPVSADDRAIAPDDPLGAHLDRPDTTFGQVSEPESAFSAPEAASSESSSLDAVVSRSEPALESLDGALSALEGALDTLTLDDVGTRYDEALTERATASPSQDGSALPPASPPVDDAAPMVEGTAWPVRPPESTSQAAVSVASLAGASPHTLPPPGDATPPREAVPPMTARAAAVRASTPSAGAGAAPPTLADAFASLLAAEQGDSDRARTPYPWPRPVSSSDVSEELIERVSERVIERLSDRVTGELVAEVVSRVAERLVREEIERIKQV